MASKINKERLIIEMTTTIRHLMYMYADYSYNYKTTKSVKKGDAALKNMNELLMDAHAFAVKTVNKFTNN